MNSLTKIFINSESKCDYFTETALKIITQKLKSYDLKENENEQEQKNEQEQENKISFLNSLNETIYKPSNLSESVIVFLSYLFNPLNNQISMFDYVNDFVGFCNNVKLDVITNVGLAQELNYTKEIVYLLELIDIDKVINNNIYLTLKKELSNMDKEYEIELPTKEGINEFHNNFDITSLLNKTK